MAASSSGESTIRARPQIFFQPHGICRAGDGDDERPLRQFPGKDDLGGRGLSAFGHVPDKLQQSLIVFHNLRPESPHETAKIAFSVHGITSEAPRLRKPLPKGL